MNLVRQFICMLVTLSAGLVLVACDGGFDAASGDIDPYEGWNFQSKATFADIYPYIRASCSVLACHGGNAGASEYLINADREATYQRTLQVINRTEPEYSVLIKKSSGEISHAGGFVIGYRTGDVGYQLFLNWIRNGANRGYNVRESQLTLSFHDYIFPILKNSCGTANCHGNPGNRFVIDSNEATTYNNVVARINRTHPADSLLLKKPSMSGVGHAGGVVSLHEAGDDNYDLIFQWIEEGVKK